MLTFALTYTILLLLLQAGGLTMTVGLAIRCRDGVVLACDSLATFTRGVPVKRFSNKVYLIEHDSLRSPVAVVGAGATAFIDKFIDAARRRGIVDAANRVNHKLDIVDFTDLVCEPIVADMYKRYVVDRYKLLGTSQDFSLFIIVAGVDEDDQIRAFFLYPDGVTEHIAHYGTIGSGAAYAELFLKSLMYNLDQLETDEAACLSVYAIKGVELMDPSVGGKTNVLILKMKDNELVTERLTAERISDRAQAEVDDILRNMGDSMRELIRNVRQECHEPGESCDD